MAAQTNLQKDILVLNLEEQLMEIAKEMYGKELSALTDQETYYAVLILIAMKGKRKYITFPQNF